MRARDVNRDHGVGPNCIRVRVMDGMLAGHEQTFAESFQIGREETCDVQIQHGNVSRAHLQVFRDGETWWVRDLGSSNGTFRDGQPLAEAPVEGEVALHLGHNGPVVVLSARSAPASDASVFAGEGPESAARAGDGTGHSGVIASASEAAAPGPSLTYFIQHYAGDEGPAGERTVFIREAFKHVHRKQRKRYTGFIVVVAVIAVAAAVFGGYKAVEHRKQQARIAQQQARIEEQEAQIAALRAQAREIFYGMKRIELAAAASPGMASDERQEVRRFQQLYAQHVDSLGIYDGLSEADRIIYRMARLFGECDLDIPPDFVVRVHDYIRRWQHSSRFQHGIRKARAGGFTYPIVETFMTHGLPPQYFYLALQESNFDVDAIGDSTRFGYAKGMWQFIPATAMQYGLRLDPPALLKAQYPYDERHDFEKSTEAAARYIEQLYKTDAQASGLLVMASYNWGEGNVINYIRQLPLKPSERNFWKLVEQYGNRIPDETYDYVFSIFSAAVIGENPRLFGFDFDPPLADAVQQVARAASVPALRPAGS